MNKDTQPQLEEDAPEVTESGNRFSSIVTLAVGSLVAVSALVLMFTLYHTRFVKPLASSFASVDIGAAVQRREAEFSALLAKPNAGDREREAAYRLVQTIGPEIEKAIGILQRECKCVILVKSAVVAGPAQDLTPRLLQLLGMARSGK